MKCLVKDCTNQSHEGHFINNLCYPCYQYITEGSGNSVLHRDAENEAMFHYKRGFQDAKEIHMRKNAGLLANIKVLEAQLEVADIRPMEESAYFDRIEELEEQVEWHKRRAEGWRSIAVLEEQGK